MENLKNLRKSKNVSQHEMAKILNMSQTGYNGYETGRTEPDIKTLKKLADYFDVSLDMLLGRPRPYDLPSSTTVKQKDVVNLVLGLNDKNCERVEFFIAGLLAGEKDQANTINNLGGK